MYWMKFLKLLVLLVLFSFSGCSTPEPPPPFVPYLFYTEPPPSPTSRPVGPTSLRCIDNSNIFVFCNEAWWYAGPQKGWIPTGGGWYPWPRQVWPSRVYNLIPPWRLKSTPPPEIPYPY